MEIDLEQLSVSHYNWAFLLDTPNESLFLFPFWRYFESIKHSIRISLKKVDHLISSAKLNAMIARDMQIIMLDLVKRTLVWEFNLCLRRKPTLTLVEFIKNVSNPNQLTILFKKYPLIERLLNRLITNYRFLIISFLLRFTNDKSELSAVFGLEGFKLSNYEITGDSHRQGGRVVLLTLKDIKEHQTKMMVYKPRNLDMEKAYNDFLLFLKQFDREISLKITTVVPKKNYGWMEFIPHQSICEEEVKNYYYEVGLLLGICSLLNGQDLHYENVIACGKNPIIIDLECLFSSPITQSQYANFHFPSLSDTLLIPYTDSSGNGILDLSALLNHAHQESMVSHFIVGGDFIREVFIDKKLASIIPCHNLLINRSNKKIYSPSNYIAEVTLGYRKLMTLIIHHKAPINQFIMNHVFHLKTRAIFRPTFIYYLLIIESYHPSLLANETTYYEHLSQLMTAQSQSDFSSLFEHERDDLLNGDIPYFSSYTSETDIENSHGVKIELQSYDTGLSRVLAKINNLSHTDILRDIKYITQTLKDRYV